MCGKFIQESDSKFHILDLSYLQTEELLSSEVRVDIKGFVAADSIGLIQLTQLRNLT